MPADDLPSNAVLEALGYALFTQEENGALRLSGGRPEWLAQLWPAGVPAVEASPFLENFLVDARECWRAGGRVESGPWVEQDGAGVQVRLQATAMRAGGQACLLVERLGATFDAEVSVLQKARETVLALHRLDAEIQKKQILVHCLAEDLSAALGNVVTSLRLVEMEQISPRASELLSLAMQSAHDQRSLIRKVLTLFPEELTGLYGGAAHADLHRAVMATVENVAVHFSEKGVRLSPPQAVELRIVADDMHVERVVGNLLRNALEHTEPGGEVVVRVLDESEAAFLAIEFPHEGVQIEADGSFTVRGEPSGALHPEASLRLHFCRIAVQSCHGEMGFRPREGGGTCVWVRLPKWSAPA